MTIDDVVSSVLLSMGHPVIDVYITGDMIKENLKKALRYCAPKFSKVRQKTLRNTGEIIFKEEDNIGSILSIYPASNTASNSDADIFLSPYMEIGSGRNDMLSRAMSIRESAERASDIITDFSFDGEVLLVDEDYGTDITIEYTPLVADIKDIDSSHYAWVEDYTLALSKIVEGKIRSKWKPSSAPHELDTDIGNEGVLREIIYKLNIKSSQDYQN